MSETLTSTLRVTPIPVPASLDAHDARLFGELVRIANDVCLVDAGHDGLRSEPLETLGFWQHQEDWISLGFAVERDDVVLGAVALIIATDPDATTIDFDLWVAPEHRGEGAEELLLAEVDREARARGRSTIQHWTLHRPGTPGPYLVPPTGFGRVPADDYAARVAVAHGFRLEQVERNSMFDLTGDLTPLAHMRDDAAAHAGADYRLELWSPPTPPELIDGFAYAISRMSTDAPQGGTVVDEEHWDADRVRRREERLVSQGLTTSVAGVVHVPTGAIVAYNELVIGEDPRAVTQQYGTLVLREHRGHRLGMLVKCANLLHWREVAPLSPSVSTFNAEENRPMLDINEAMGFVPVSYAGAWRKEIG
ncbi:GNAT family N-acetyltransferase [Microbacterium hominis]|uniref:GNAT family N-acetyltransferase n=1 Tax=Microbacterium hominis TaxID=162426 RepID=A0A7D4QCH4_9MICO|nr:GNAT family N-acetyltransferase [Microbacterium hominis]QKJ19257.1 GNAT family N-acetyltransferase [Microbacterium hominis]